MMTRQRGLASRVFPCLLLFLLAAPSAFALEASFEFYPKTAQACLSKAAKSSECSGDTAKELNTCLCSNGGQFIGTVIRCLVQQDTHELGDVYTTMDNACYASGTPLSWKWSDWLDTAKSAQSSSTASSSTETASTESSSTISTETASTASTKSTSTTSATKTASSASSDSSSGSSFSSSEATATATNSPTSSPSPTPGDSSSSNLSTTATIGIAAGVSVAGVAAIAGLAFFLVRKRKRASRPPMTYAMLTPEKYNGAGGAATSYPPHDPSKPNLGGGGAGFDSEANETPLYTVPTYVAKSQRKQSYTALSSTSPDSGMEQQQQQQQHNFLAGWEPPAHAQYTGPYAPPQTGPVELPPQTQPVSNVFELDSHGVVAAPRPAQPALQPIAERQRESRMYRPYMPT